MGTQKVLLVFRALTLDGAGDEDKWRSERFRKGGSVHRRSAAASRLPAEEDDGVQEGIEIQSWGRVCCTGEKLLSNVPCHRAYNSVLASLAYEVTCGLRMRWIYQCSEICLRCRPCCSP